MIRPHFPKEGRHDPTVLSAFPTNGGLAPSQNGRPWKRRPIYRAGTQPELDSFAVFSALRRVCDGSCGGSYRGK